MLLPLLLWLASLAVVVVASALFVGWVRYLKPTDGDDMAHGVCLFEDYLAAVGEADLSPFVALLDRATGEVVKTWRGELGWLRGCVSMGDRLYVVGWHAIYTFDRGLNVLKWVELGWRPYAVSFDGGYLYLAGAVDRDVNGDGFADVVWRIEKRTLDLDLVGYWEFYEPELYRVWDSDRRREHRLSLEAYDVAVNPATGDVWAVGHVGIYHGEAARSIYSSSLLVVLDRGLGVKRVAEYPRGRVGHLGGLGGVCFDDYGDAYVVGEQGVAKFDKGGDFLVANRGVGGDKIACVGGRVYVFGEKYVDGVYRHVLYVFDRELNLVDELILSRGVEADSYFLAGSPAFDGRSLYVAGHDLALGEGKARIVVYSISAPTPA
mgnify:CR=1 FL=1